MNEFLPLPGESGDDYLARLTTEDEIRDQIMSAVGETIAGYGIDWRRFLPEGGAEDDAEEEGCRRLIPGAAKPLS